MSDLLTGSAPPRELSAFLTDLAVAVHTHGVYPAGHPMRARTSQALHERASALLAERASVSVGVARRRLVVEGVATPEEHPLLGSLAERLHRMRVGAVTLHRGLGADEVDVLLAALAAEPERGAVVRSEAWPEGPHLRLHPLRFGDLAMAETDEDTPADAEGASRAAELWIGLAQAAISGEPSADSTGDPSADAADVARAIDSHPAAEAYDQVVVGYLLQLAEELKSDSASSASVRFRASQVVAGLSPETLRRLLRMGGDEAQRRRFLLDASRGFASEAVVRLVEAAAEASGQTVSHSLLRMLQKLAAFTDRGATAAVEADAALAEQVRALVGDWSLADPNPDAYTAALQRYTEAPARPTATGARDGWETEPERVLKMALEAEADGEPARAAVQRMLVDGRTAEVIAILSTAPDASKIARSMWSLVASADGLGRLLAARQPDAAALDAVLARMGDASIPVLLDAMAGSPSRMVRRVTFDRLAAMGPAAAQAAAERAGDERWFVARNVLSLLAETGAPAGFSPAPFLRHADVRVRREAFKLAFRMKDERTRALCLALAEDDEPCLRLALNEALAGCPAEAVPMVCRLAASPGCDAEVRALAFRVLGTTADALALRTLLAALDGGRDWLGRRKLPPRSPELLAALAALGAGFRAHPAAADVLSRARSHADALVRTAAEGRA